MPTEIPCKIGSVGPQTAKQCKKISNSMQCKNPLQNIYAAPDEAIRACISSPNNSKYVAIDNLSNMQCCDYQGLITTSTPEWTGFELIPDPVQPKPSFTCSGHPNYNCFDPEDSTGQYSSEDKCNKNCTKPTESWGCTGKSPTTGQPWQCVKLPYGAGQYLTQTDCTNHCTADSHVTYNCNNNKCSDPGDGTGDYTSLDECNKACYFPQITWNCNDYGGCQAVYDTGAYKTLDLCKKAKCKPKQKPKHKPNIPLIITIFTVILLIIIITLFALQK